MRPSAKFQAEFTDALGFRPKFNYLKSSLQKSPSVMITVNKEKSLGLPASAQTSLLFLIEIKGNQQ